jgi:hypothetical protein
LGRLEETRAQTNKSDSLRNSRWSSLCMESHAHEGMGSCSKPPYWLPRSHWNDWLSEAMNRYNHITKKYLLNFMNRCIRGPYVQWCERRTSPVNSGEAVYSILCCFQSTFDYFHLLTICLHDAFLKIIYSNINRRNITNQVKHVLKSRIVTQRTEIDIEGIQHHHITNPIGNSFLQVNESFIKVFEAGI